MPVSTLTDQCDLWINGQHIPTSRITLRVDTARREAPFVDLTGDSVGTFRGKKTRTLDFECPASPEFPIWEDLEEAVVQLLPKRPSCPKYSYSRCSSSSFESGVQNDQGETVDRVSLLLLTGKRIA